jgi:Domain of unknown function (DUF5916)/Carbohydrate family 9 binding domain-like
MTRNTALLLLSLAIAPLAQAANWPDHPTLRAVRVTKPPVIDGDLSDPAWAEAPEFTDFTQHDPDDTKPATLRTSIRILYDDKAIYFGAKMDDTHRPTALLARRDSFLQSDFLSINIDSQLDRLSGAAFTVYPTNTQIDSILFNDIGEDGSWDAVWDSATKVLENGWIAEVRVPFSQLRFPEKPVHVWGLNITRRTVRNNEWARIVNTPKGQTGFVSHFADIVGIEGIRRERPLELVPYAVGRSDVLSRRDRLNPFLEQVKFRNDAGLDVKYGLTSNLTLTGTINPDFGQVEVDPAVVNLSQFETFFPEKRPFFTEGVNIFRFGDTPAQSHFNFFFPPQVFYSRRIGRSPQAGIDADYVASPAETTILGAAKLTGKAGNGWSIGVLDALTDAERARFVRFGPTGIIEEDGRQQVEPMTNYFVSRATKEIGDRGRVGFLLTSVKRRLPDDLDYLREDAVTLGTDGYAWLFKRNWIFEWAGTGTRVSGSEQAIAITQATSAHYYQRPDAEHVELDPTRTSLDGWSGRAMMSKQTGDWRPNLSIQAYSPGFETNDVGFMQRTDIVSAHAIMQYINQRPSKHVRERQLWVGTWHNRNFDGDRLDYGFFADHFATLQNFWNYRAALFVTPSSLSDRLTRGGPLARTPFGWSSDLSFGSDDRKPFYFSVNGHLEDARDGSYVRSGGVELAWRPAPNLVISVSPYYSRSHDHTQYVFPEADPAATGTFGTRHVFADLEQHSFELATRADWTLSSRLSFQLYLQPFIAAGDYHDYHSLVRARTRDFEPYTKPVADPDFNFRSVRGSAVARWEFRPGSALFVAWNENREAVLPIGDFRLGRDLRAIPTARSHDVFLVKVSYWLPL